MKPIGALGKTKARGIEPPLETPLGEHRLQPVPPEGPALQFAAAFYWLAPSRAEAAALMEPASFCNTPATTPIS